MLFASCVSFFFYNQESVFSIGLLNDSGSKK